MSEEAKSNVIPVLIAALICDVAVADPSTGKKNLIGIFDTLYSGQFPTARFMCLYVKLADAQGKYDLAFRFVEMKTDTPIAEARAEFQTDERLRANDIMVQFPQPLPIPREGRYEFRIFANKVYLGGAFLDAVPRPPQAELELEE